MEQEAKPSIVRGTLVYGLIVGLSMVVVSMVLYFVDKSLETWSGVLTTLLFMGLIALSLILFKREYTDGYIKYGRVVVGGLLISVFAGFILVLQSYALFKFDDSYLQDTKYFAIEQVNKRIDKMDLKYQERLSDDEYAMFEDRMEDGRQQAIDKIKDRSAFAFSFPGLFNYLLLGVVAALITGIFIRKNPPEGPEIVQ
jgi:K+ transporter